MALGPSEKVSWNLSEFSVGDRVKVTPTTNARWLKEGMATVIAELSNGCSVQEDAPFKMGDGIWAANDSELTLVTDEAVKHPAHYGGADNPYEAIKVIKAWELGFSLGNVAKYIARAGKKDKTKEIEDLKKARFYLDDRIKELEAV
jgi:hypothetical protein